MWTVRLPLSVPVSSRKQFHLNLNHYRNAHFQVLTKAKKAFDQEVKHLIRGIPRLRNCTLEYVLYTGSRQLCDTNNICTVADKFFADTLVKHGVLEDDNYNLLVDTRFRFGAIDKANPRVEVIIRSPDHASVVPPAAVKADTHMQISRKTSILATLTQEDFHAAIKEYLAKHITVPEGATVSIEEQEDYNYQVRIETDELPAQLEMPARESTPRRIRVHKERPEKDIADTEKEKAAASQPEPTTPVTNEPPFEPDVKPQVAETAAPAPVPTRIESAATKAPEPAPAEAPKAPSLFAGLKRPTNP